MNRLRSRPSLHKRSIIISLSILLGFFILAGVSSALFLGGTQVPSSSSSIDLSKGLIGWWKMNGNVNDSTPYADNGIVSGTSFTTGRNGQTNGAITFNGTSDYVYAKIGDGSYFGNSSSALTASAWVYASSTSNGPVFGVTASPPGGGWNMPFLSIDGSTVYGYVWSNTPMSYTVSANSWHLLTLTYNGSGTTTLYVDGNQVASESGSYSSSGTVDYFTTYIGGSKPSGVNSYLNTPIEDVRAYDRVLNPNEIMALYSGNESQINLANDEQGLIGWWRLNGNGNDSTPYGDNGTINAVTSSVDEQGVANRAYSFNGASSYITVPKPSLFAPTSNFTISAWVETNTLSVNNSIVQEENGTGTGRTIVLLDPTTNKLASFLGAAYTDGPTVITTGKWYFVTVVHSGNTVTVYTNGVAGTPNTITAEAATGGFDFGSGKGHTGQFWNGSISDVRLYDSALSAAQISELYSSYNSQVDLGGDGQSSGINLQSGLIGYWPFNGNALDATPYSDNGTINGATLTTDRNGRANSAYSFNGSSDISVGPLDGGGISTNSITFTAWIYPTGTQSAYTGIVFSRNSTEPIGMDLDSYGTALVYCWNNNSSSTYGWNSGLTIVPNKWNFVAITLSPTSAIGYLGTGGSLQSSTNSVANINQSLNGVFEIGNDSGGSRYFNGSIDDVRIYNRSLSAGEIEALYQQYQ